LLSIKRLIRIGIPLILITVCPVSWGVYGKTDTAFHYQYISPRPFSSGHNPETAVILRYGMELDRNSVEGKYFSLSGNISGDQEAILKLAADNRTLIIKPGQPFEWNERVQFSMSEGIVAVNGSHLPAIDFWFGVRESPRTSNFLPQVPLLKSVSEIPEVTILKNENPAPGFIFCTLTGTASSFLYAFDNYGTPVFYREFPYLVYNLRPGPNGILTYHDSELNGFVALDRRYEPVDTFLMENGYSANMHEFVLLENGHALMLAYDYRPMDLSEIFEDGDSNALVIGFIIQEFDENKDLLFQWRSWDHLDISGTFLECRDNFLNRFTICDYAHANSIDADSDTSLILSTRNLSEITRIHRKTGDIIWRMGGKNNEFSFIDDPKAFRGQHTVIRQANGNITLLDNGLDSDSLYSRGIEYHVDEKQKTVHLVREFLHDPAVYAYAMGNLQRMEDGRTLIYWGVLPGDSSAPVTEYDQGGRVVFEAVFDRISLPSYRCYRAEWTADVFELDVDTLHFKQTATDPYPVKSFRIGNKTRNTLSINKMLGQTGKFTIDAELPLILPAGEYRMIEVGFHADSAGQYRDVLTFSCDTDTSRVSAQLPVTAEALMTTGESDGQGMDLSIGPNPVVDLLEIRSGRTVTGLQVSDVNGRQVYLAEVPGNCFSISLEKLETGIYILGMDFSDGTRSRSMIIKVRDSY
jgi:hypothetical protein